MSVKYLVQFVIHVDETKRPHDVNFKQEYYINHMLQFDNEEHMGRTVNEIFQNYTRDPGLTVFEDGGFDAGLPGVRNIGRRRFIPWHMITFMDANIKLIADVADTKLTLLEPGLLINEQKETVN